MLRFKNKRNYLHSSDIFNYYFRNTKFDYLDLKFIKKLNSIPIISKTPLAKKKVSIEIAKKTNKKKSNIFFYNSNNKIKTRKIIKEKIDTKFYKVFKRSINCNFISNKSEIEILITLTKALHFKNIKNQDWYLTRLTLKKNLKKSKYKKFKVVLKENFNNILTNSDIYQNEIKIGQIQFIKK